MGLSKYIKNAIKMVFNPELRTRVLRKRLGTAELFDKYDAKQIYLQSVYEENTPVDDNIRMKDFLDYTVMRTIRDKSARREMDCTVDIPEDLMHKKDEIIQRIREKGFDSDWLGEFRPYLSRVIVISWRDFSTCQMRQGD